MVEAREIPPRQFSTAALNALRNYDWPGNLTQLESVVRTLALVKSGNSPALSDWFQSEMKQTSSEISALQKGLDAALAREQEQDAMAAVATARTAYVDLRGSLLKRMADPAQAQAAMAEVEPRMMPAANGYLRSLDNVLARVDARLSDQSTR